MSMGWAPSAFEAAGDWHLWLMLTAILVLSWVIVVAATAMLFDRPAAERRGRPTAAEREESAAGSDKPPHKASPQQMVGNG